MLSDHFRSFIVNANIVYPKVRIIAASKPREGVSVYLVDPEAVEEVIYNFDCCSESQAIGVVTLLVLAGSHKTLADVAEKLA